MFKVKDPIIHVSETIEPDTKGIPKDFYEYYSPEGKYGESVDEALGAFYTLNRKNFPEELDVFLKGNLHDYALQVLSSIIEESQGTDKSPYKIVIEPYSEDNIIELLFLKGTNSPFKQKLVDGIITSSFKKYVNNPILNINYV